MAVVRILGVDPGTHVVGYGCLEIADRDAGDPAGARSPAPLALRAGNVVRLAGSGADSVALVAAGVVRLGGRGVELAIRLGSLAAAIRELFLRLGPHELAVEEAFHGKSVQAALRIGEARGVVIAESARCGAPVFQYPPARIKRCVTGRGSARKESVAAMLDRLLPGLRARIGELPADASDAVAVAWTRLEERRSPLSALGQAAARRPGPAPDRGTTGPHGCFSGRLPV